MVSHKKTENNADYLRQPRPLAVCLQVPERAEIRNVEKKTALLRASCMHARLTDDVTEEERLTLDQHYAALAVVHRRLHCPHSSSRRRESALDHIGKQSKKIKHH